MAKPLVYTPKSTGSVVERDIRDRFADIVNVKDYGAVGNGSNNDTEAFFAAVTVANGKNIFIPSGTYKINSSITGNFITMGGVSFSGTGVVSTVKNINSFADDSTVVHNSGNESIGGTKTFISTISGSINGNAATATKATQDGNGNNIVNTYAVKSTVVSKSGNETINGTKTFTSTISGNINGSANSATTATKATQDGSGNNIVNTYAKKTDVVNITGNQTIAGTKTFSSTIAGSINGNAATATKATNDANGNNIVSTYSTKNIAGGHAPFNIHAGVAKAKLVVRSDQRGTGDNSRAVVQSVTYDPVNRLLFMLHEKGYISGNSGARYAAISRHELTTGTDIVTTKDISSLTLDNVGHQGLAVEVITSLNTSTSGLVKNNYNVRLWSSNKYGQDGGTALRFSYSAGNNVGNIQQYKLVDVSGNLSLAPTISYDQRYLLVTYRDTSSNYHIRVFNLKTLVDGGAGNYTSNYIADFPVYPTLSSYSNGAKGFQCMACDGYYVYILASKTNTTQPAAIWCYTLDGKLVTANQYVTLGFQEAYNRNQELTDKNDVAFCEPEAIFIMPVSGIPRLCLGVNVQSPWASKAGKALYVYALGANDIGASV